MATKFKTLLLLLGTVTALIGQPGPFSPCDVNQDAATNVADVQTVINEALGVTPGTNDLNGDHSVNVADVQIVINAALGLGCSAGAGATISDFNPKSGAIGTLVTITGSNFAAAPQVSMPKQGGGTIGQPISTVSASSVSFVIAAGTATGPIVLIGGAAAVSTSSAFTVTPPNTFSLAVLPAAANLIQGQAVSYSVQLSSSNGFNQLAALSVTGTPNGVAASFVPPSITAGQSAVLTLTAPANQPIVASNLSITAAAAVSGIAVSQSTPASLAIVAPSTSFLGRTVVADSPETALAGVTVSMLGDDGNGHTTGCTGTSVSDAAGNVALTSLPAACVGPQLIGFNGTTATSPPGAYAGVNIVYTLMLGQVAASPVLVHLPRIDNVETFYVTQNSASIQSHQFTSIPGLSVTAYPGTTLTMPDGTQPNPFPLAAVEVPVDRLPDLKPNVPTMIRAFIVAFQPANATANAPVAVYFPNTLNSAPGTDMVLMTLDPTHGQMVPYGTGAVSPDGTQIVPDADPSHPGHLYGLIHFDWHGPMPPTGPDINPAPPDNGPGPCGVGGAPGGGSGAGGCGPTPQDSGPPDSGPPDSNPPDANSPPNSDPDAPGGPASGGPPSSGPASAGPAFGGPASGNPASGGCAPGTRGAAVLRRPAATNGRFLAAGDSGDLARVILAGENRGRSTETSAQAGDPVDLASGLQVIANADLGFAGSRGAVSLVRTYRSLSTNPGPFGIGTGHNYGLLLDLGGVLLNGSGVISLLMPDGNRFLFSVTSSGTFINTSIPAFAGAVLTNLSIGHYNLRYRNGLTYVFQTSALGPFESFLTAIIEPNGNTISVAWNPLQPLQVTAVSDPAGRSLTFTYDSANRITSVTDPAARIVRYTYNSQGTLATCTDPIGGVTNYAYDANNNLIGITDPRGIVQMQNTLDSSGRVIKQVRPDGGVLNFSYTLANSLAAASPVIATQVTDSRGVQSTYRFNVTGFMTDITSSQGQTEHFTLQSGTNLRSAVTFGSATTRYTYDSRGNILTTTDPTGLTTSFTYDSIFNEVTSITDPLGHQASFTYDALGNLVTATDANGHITSVQYDANGLPSKVTDALQQTTTISYDGVGNPIRVADPLGNAASYVYDAVSRLTQTIDPLGRRTSFTYDGLDRLIANTDAAGGTATASFDADGNLVSLKDTRGNTNTFAYDSMNRLLSRTDGLGNSDMRTWDTDSNLTGYVDRRGQASTFAYDNLNRLTTETYPDATVTRAYDVYGRLIQANDSAGGLFAYSYDLAGRLLGSTTPYGSVSYRYDGRGAMASRQVSGQAALSYAYDPAGNLLSASIPQASANFAYNPRNQLSLISRDNGVSSTYTYDASGRLLDIAHAKGTAALASNTYGYDAAGSRQGQATSIGQPLATAAVTRTFNAANQLTQSGADQNRFDANGNLAQQGTAATYTWDGRNRLKSVVMQSGQTTTFIYDFAGNLLSQSVSGPTVNLTTSFVLDSLTNLAFASSSDGTSYSVLSGREIDSQLAVSKSNGQTLFGLSDGINSTVATLDQAGAQQAQFVYEPFGQTSTTGEYPFQYTGRTPVSADLYYYRSRWYSAATGRFLSEDSGADGMNYYAYVGDSPITYTDPLGQRACGGAGHAPATGALSIAVGGLAQTGAGVSHGYFFHRFWAWYSSIHRFTAPPHFFPGKGRGGH